VRLYLLCVLDRLSTSSIESHPIGDGTQIIYRKTSAEQVRSNPNYDDTSSISSTSGSFRSSISSVSRNDSFNSEVWSTDQRSPLSNRPFPTEERIECNPKHVRNRSYSSISEEDIDALNNIDINENVIVSRVKLSNMRQNIDDKSEFSSTAVGRTCYVVGKPKGKKISFSDISLSSSKPTSKTRTKSANLTPLDVYENYAFSPRSCEEVNAVANSEKKKKSRKVSIKKSSSFKEKILSPLLSKRLPRLSTSKQEKQTEERLTKSVPPYGSDSSEAVEDSTQNESNSTSRAEFFRFSDVRQNVTRKPSTNPQVSRHSSKSSSTKSRESYEQMDNSSDVFAVSSTVENNSSTVYQYESSDNHSPITYSDCSFSDVSGDDESCGNDNRMRRVQYRKQRQLKYSQKIQLRPNNTIRNSSPVSSTDSQYGGSCLSSSSNSLQSFTFCTDIANLPDATLVNIFSYLTTCDLCRVSQVCKRWNALYLSEELWQQIQITNLSRLDIDDIMNILLQRLAYSTSCLGIRQIRLDGCLRLSDSGLKVIALRCPELRALEISSCTQVTPKGVHHVLTNCPNMLYLNLSKCDSLTGFSYEFLTPLTFSAMRYLDLSTCSSVTDEDLHDFLSSMNYLQYLFLRRCDYISNVGLETIARYCQNLKEVSLNDCVNVTDHGIVKLLQSCQNVRYLSLAKCPISNSVLEQLASVPNNSLRHVNFYDCDSITDSGIMKLSASCPRLRSLDIGRCAKLTDASLYGLSRCTFLRRLNLRGCERVTDAGIRKLATTCTNLRNLDVRECVFSSETFLYVKRHCTMCDIKHQKNIYYF